MTQRLSKTNKLVDLDDVFSSLAQIPSNAYSAQTGGVEVKVWPEFITNQNSATGNIFIWAYHVKISNRGKDSLKLINRHWKIINEKGEIQEVDGEGVVGEQPVIASGSSFQYSSGVHLYYPSGIMTGHYQMQKEDGALFQVQIPAFSLDTPDAKSAIN